MVIFAFSLQIGASTDEHIQRNLLEGYVDNEGEGAEAPAGGLHRSIQFCSAEKS